MNRIQSSYVNEFAVQYGLQDIAESEKFEKFTGYCFLYETWGQDTITNENLDNIKIGNGNDWGIDNIIILVNNNLISQISELDYYISTKQKISVRIILIQAKTASSLDIGELSKFLKGSRDVLSYINDKNTKLPPKNEKLAEKLAIINKIYDQATQFAREDAITKPRYHLYYVIGGENTNDPNAASSISETETFINTFNLIDDFKCTIVGASDICNIYSNSKSALTRNIEVTQELKMPAVKEIVESHLCLLPFSEFRKLIIDENDTIIKSIFEDNVRDFQGDKNPVNQAIDKTIKEGQIKLFTALNNGITVIAKNMKYVGTKMELEDYQIVNGCQTCHVLYDNRNLPGIDNLLLTVKIISSTDKDIRDKIIVANNSQTAVQREQLTSLLQAQRNIEEYYKVQNNFTKLYYERRSKQYRYCQEQISADRVITIPYQIMAFVSMILGEPHLTSNYYGKLIDTFNGENGRQKIFDSKQNPAYYYMSALASYYRDKLLSAYKIRQELRYVKHHLLYALRLTVISKSQPKLNSNNSEKYCDEVCRVLCDEQQCIKAFERAGNLIINTLGRLPVHNDLNDTKLAKRIAEYFYSHGNDFGNTEANVNDSCNQKPPKINLKIVGKIDLDKLSK